MKTVIYEIEQKRERLLKLFISSVALAFAVSLIANYLCNRDINNLWALITGCSLIATILIIYYVFRFCHRVKKFTYEPSLIIDESRKIAYVPGYGISCDMENAMKYACSETEGLKNLWYNEKKEDFLKKDSNTAKLLKECVEYCILQKLSTHTTDYFNVESKENLSREYKGDELSTLILNNRFIKLFSEPMENRSVFNSNGQENKKKAIVKAVDGDREEIIMAFTEQGRYEKFSFNLPNGAKITKTGNTSVVFDFKYFTLSMNVGYHGFSATIPNDFIKYYSGVSNLKEAKTRKFSVNITIKEKVKSVFYPFKKAEYEWIDSFLKKMSSYLNLSSFMELIGWNQLHAQMVINRNANRFAAQKKAEEQKGQA